MNKTICLAVLAGMAILLASCAKVENPDLPETVGQGNIVTVTTTVSMGEGTRALDAAGVKSFSAGDRIAVFYSNGTSTVKAVSEPLAAGSYTNSATFTFYLVNPVAGSVTLHYPAAMVDSDGEVDYSALATQDGTLSSLGNTLDYASGTGTLSLSGSSPSLTASSALTNQLAIGAFTIQNAAGTDINNTITGLTVTDGTNTYTVTRTAAEGPIYVAMKPVSNASISFTATDGTKTYVKAVSGKTLAASGIYPIGVTVALPGAINSVFSVSETKQVFFSKGNLLYSNGTWRFHDNQYDRCFTSDSNDVSSFYTSSGTFDLFGWATTGFQDTRTASSGYQIFYEPYSTDNNYISDTEDPRHIKNTYGYGPDFDVSTQYGLSIEHKSDWGMHPITNGGNTAGIWRTLTKDEWVYVCKTRSTASGVRYAKATVNGIGGLIILPDNWDTAYYALEGTNTANTLLTINTISLDDWNMYFEANGAVFLPAAGHRALSEVEYTGEGGYYWSSTCYVSSYSDPTGGSSYYLYFYGGERWYISNKMEPDYYSLGRYNGFSVRLVSDVN